MRMQNGARVSPCAPVAFVQEVSPVRPLVLIYNSMVDTQKYAHCSEARSVLRNKSSAPPLDNAKLSITQYQVSFYANNYFE